MRRTASKILLTIYLISVSIVPSIEACHHFLHTFENPFHHHKVKQPSVFAHSSSEHRGFGKMKFAHEMYSSESLSNLVWFAYTFVNSIDAFDELRSRGWVYYSNPFFISYYYVTLLPPVPPPQRG